MTNQLNDLRTALEDVPTILLDDDLVRGIADAKAAVDALEQIGPDPTVIVVSGPAGSGKSTLVNALVGEDVAVVSAIRPTTTAMTAIGAGDVVRIAGATEFVVTDSLPRGVVVVDTPPWDRASESITSVMEVAALTFVIVTPARYGDDATHENIAAASSVSDMVLIANRLPKNEGEREQIEDAIHERLDIKPLATFSEGERFRFDVSPIDGIQSKVGGNATRRVLRKAAAATSRKIAAAITADAAQIGKVEQVLSATPNPQVTIGSVGTSTWEGARTQLVRASVDLADAYDTSVERTAGNDLAVRIRRSLGPLDGAAIADALDNWRDETTRKLVENARFGFRRKSGLRIIERHGWVAVVDGDVPKPRRFVNMLRGSGQDITTEASNGLTQILESPALARRELWRSILREAGDYQPGELLVAAEAVGESMAEDD